MSTPTLAPALHRFHTATLQRRSARSSLNVGVRSTVTGAGHVDGLIEAIMDALVAAGVRREDMLVRHRVTLPGAYGSTAPQVDLAIVDGDLLIGAIEVIVDSGLPNNFNNRVDGMLGFANNINRAYSVNADLPFEPCVGLFVVLEMNSNSLRPLRGATAVMPSARHTGFEPVTLVDRYAETLRKFLGDGLVDAACFVTVQHDPSFAFAEPDPAMAFASFVSGVASRIEAIREIRGQAQEGPVEFGRRLSGRADAADVMAGFASTPSGLSAAEGAVVRERRRVVAELRELAADPATTETTMQKAIGNRFWLFGGQYVGVLDRRSLAPLDEYDIPLLCADGSLHVIELKAPNERLVKRHRSHFIASQPVHEAVSQCRNYLRTLDELGPALSTTYRNELGLDIDLRRTRGTVVIGHRDHGAPADVSQQQVEQTLRSYNADMSRVQVLTYSALLDAADRALQFQVAQPAG
ncbi:hypothetical protein GCM10009827_015980 [Dactylosporangium maewongense]|uniref:Shedu protein SduA C-terminal domain-containing protein n=1 Tax=Dactylosporangium maewongense TaxID=634393 RepID=A0ABN1ZTL5_9ACTN